MSLPEIKIKKSLKKRKGYIISPREGGRTIKVRITNKNCQANNQEEEKECKERQVERGEVTEEEPLFEL